MLGAASASGLTTRNYVDSGVIDVHAGSPAVQRPSEYTNSYTTRHTLLEISLIADFRKAPTQINKLQSLIPENIDISAADIATWQQA
jgi:hypothetical protein